MTIYDSIADIYDNLKYISRSTARTKRFKEFHNILKTLDTVLWKIDESAEVDRWDILVFKRGVYLLKALTFRRDLPHYITENLSLIDDIFTYGHYVFDDTVDYRTSSTIGNELLSSLSEANSAFA